MARQTAEQMAVNHVGAGVGGLGAKGFVNAWNRQRRNLNEAEMARESERSIGAAAAVIIPLNLALDAGVSMMQRGFEGAASTVPRFPVGGTKAAADELLTSGGTITQRAIQFAERNGAALVTEVNTASRRAIRQAIREGLRQGVHVNTVAKEVGDLVGLHTRYANAVRKRRILLAEQGFSAARVDREVTRYANRLRKARAANIARTEVVNAMHEGRAAMFDELGRRGEINPARIEKEWLTAGDERVRDFVCLGLEGVVVQGLATPFPGGHTPTVHPGCRCVIVYSEVSP